jgi:hypothetical protein
VQEDYDDELPPSARPGKPHYEAFASSSFSIGNDKRDTRTPSLSLSPPERTNIHHPFLLRYKIKETETVFDIERLSKILLTLKD